MKNLSLILNIVLLVAVAVLYVLHFSGSKSAVSTGTSSTPGDAKIAYINSDTILKYYDFHKSNVEIMEAKAKRLDQDFRNRAEGLQNEFAAYQRNVNSMTLGQVKATEEDLAKKQQNLQLYQQSLNQEVMNDEARLNKQLYDRVTTFLKKYSDEKGYQIVLKYDPSSDLLVGNQALDISQDVVKRLNEEYKVEKQGGAKTDSTAVKK